MHNPAMGENKHGFVSLFFETPGENPAMGENKHGFGAAIGTDCLLFQFLVYLSIYSLRVPLNVYLDVFGSLRSFCIS